MKTDDTTLGKKLKPALRLIKDLDRGEFEQLIDGMRLLFDGIQEFKARAPRTEDIEYNPYAISKAVIDKVLPDDIDEADEALTQEMKKTKKRKK